MQPCILLFLEISPLRAKAEIQKESIPCWLRFGGMRCAARKSIPCWHKRRVATKQPLRKSADTHHGQPEHSSRKAPALPHVRPCVRFSRRGGTPYHSRAQNALCRGCALIPRESGQAPGTVKIDREPRV